MGNFEIRQNCKPLISLNYAHVSENKKLEILPTVTKSYYTLVDIGFVKPTSTILGR